MANSRRVVGCSPLSGLYIAEKTTRRLLLCFPLNGGLYSTTNVLLHSGTESQDWRMMLLISLPPLVRFRILINSIRGFTKSFALNAGRGAASATTSPPPPVSASQTCRYVERILPAIQMWLRLINSILAQSVHVEWQCSERQEIAQWFQIGNSVTNFSECNYTWRIWQNQLTHRNWLCNSSFNTHSRSHYIRRRGRINSRIDNWHVRWVVTTPRT